MAELTVLLEADADRLKEPERTVARVDMIGLCKPANVIGRDPTEPVGRRIVFTDIMTRFH